MKTTEEIILDFDDLVLTNKSAKGFKMYKLKPSGDLLKDFFDFTEVQGGGRSCNPTDPYLKMLGHWPPKPYKDGKLYHTVRDITWDTFKMYCPTFLVEQFYDMSDDTRMFIVKNMIRGAIITNNDVINYLLGYCIWGTGNCKSELNLYKTWYKTNLQKDIDSMGARTVFMRLLDIRKFRTTSTENPGWVGGIICFYKLFKNYLKS